MDNNQNKPQTSTDKPKVDPLDLSGSKTSPKPSSARMQYFENQNRSRGNSDITSWRTPTKDPQDVFYADTGSIRKKSFDAASPHERTTPYSERSQIRIPEYRYDKETKKLVESARIEYSEEKQSELAPPNIQPSSEQLEAIKVVDDSQQGEYLKDKPVLSGIVKKFRNSGVQPQIFFELQSKIKELEETKQRKEQITKEKEEKIKAEMAGDYDPSECENLAPQAKEEDEKVSESPSVQKDEIEDIIAKRREEETTVQTQEKTEEKHAPTDSAATTTDNSNFPRNFSFCQTKEEEQAARIIQKALQKRFSKENITEKDLSQITKETDTSKDISYSTIEKQHDQTQSPQPLLKSETQENPFDSQTNNTPQTNHNRNPSNPSSEGTEAKKQRRSRKDRKKSGKGSVRNTMDLLTQNMAPRDSIFESPPRDQVMICPSPEKHKFIVLQRTPSSPQKAGDRSPEKQKAEESDEQELSRRDQIMRGISPKRSPLKVEPGMTRQMFIQKAKENQKISKSPNMPKKNRQSRKQKEKVVFQDLDQNDMNNRATEYTSPQKMKSSIPNPYSDPVEKPAIYVEDEHTTQHVQIQRDLNQDMDREYKQPDTHSSGLRKEPQQQYRDLYPIDEEVSYISGNEKRDDREYSSRDQDKSNVQSTHSSNQHPALFEDFKAFCMSKFEDQIFQKAFAMQLVFMYFHDKLEQQQQQQQTNSN